MIMESRGNKSSRGDVVEPTTELQQQQIEECCLETGSLVLEAARYGNAELLKDLLDFRNGETQSKRTKIYANFCEDGTGYTGLHYAALLADKSCAELLVMADADVNVFANPSGNCKTPLHLAAESGNVEICKVLVGAGADVFSCDKDGYSSLEVSQMCDNQEVNHVLLDAIDKRQKMVEELKTNLDLASIKSDIESAENILREASNASILSLVIHGHREDYSPLCKACERGSLSLVELLLKFGADGRPHPYTSYSPLYLAVQRGYVDIAKLLIKYFPDMVRTPSFEKGLPIHAVAQTGNLECACLLLDISNYPRHILQTFHDASNRQQYLAPFDVNFQDVNCQTPLFIACCSRQLKIVELLLNFAVKSWPIGDQSPANISDDQLYEDVLNLDEIDDNDSINMTGNEPGLKRSRSKLNTASMTSQNENATTTTIFEEIRPVALDCYSTKGVTALHASISRGFLDVAKLLVENGADLSLPVALSDDEMRKLSNAPFDSTKNKDDDILQICGSGALVETCKLGDINFLIYLLEKGAVDLENKALRVCAARKFDEMCAVLLSKRVFADPEFRINKKSVELDRQQQSGSLTARDVKGRGIVLPSLMYPSGAAMLNWHNANLQYLRGKWLLDAGLQLNKKLTEIAANSPNIILAAITRLDVAKNKLTTLPSVLFKQLTSLRILNVSHNLIEKLSAEDDGSDKWNAPVLEEIHLEHNKLESAPSCLFNLPNLQGLDLSNNKLTVLPAEMWTCRKLKDLNLSYNRLNFLPVPTVDSDFFPSAIVSTTVSIQRRRCTSSGRHNDEAEGLPILSPVSAPITDMTGTSVDETAESISLNSLHLGVAEENLTYQELKRHNLWQRTLELSRLQDEDEVLASNQPYLTQTDEIFQSNSTAKSETSTIRSCLTSLNLCHNEFDKMPDFLPCLTPNLSRLTLSQNRLTVIGPVNSFPLRLKHLDLSNNMIKYWFLPPTGSSCVCGSNNNFSAAPTPTPPPQQPQLPPSGLRGNRSPLAGRRSHSLARHSASSRSLSVAPASRQLDNVSEGLTLCPHRRHTRLDNLRTLVLAGNLLEGVCLPYGTMVANQRESTNRKSSSGGGRLSGGRRRFSTEKNAEKQSQSKNELVFAHISMFDLSTNNIRSIPPDISHLSSLSVLNLSNNAQISSLPPEMGLLSKLWNLNLSGCNLGEPLKSMLDSKRYKTMDIIGYLKSILEDSKTYARLKLMIVGVQGIGKTTLLEQLRQEGTGSYRRQPPDGWAKRMGNKNINQKTNRGVTISTVGVDLNDWTYEPKKARNNPTDGPVTFRTWDFGGQREYYATHQYFLSRRSLYLVVWRVTDGESGVSEITQWLVNIQARAPNAPVIIVGTHYDEILNNSKKFHASYIDELQRLIRDRFVAVQDADKKGLPRVVDSVIISCKTRFNIRVLCDLIYHTASELRAPGAKERLLEQKVPASYLALEEIVYQLANERKQNSQDPVLTAAYFRRQVQEMMKKQYGKQFRDVSELNQAASFLHDNGVLLHYDDATLKDLYFLDPQWLCDILAHVITIREINPFAKNGLMKTDDLKILFKSSKFSPSNIRNYILNLIQKFEVALTWDNRTLLIPSLLPDEYQLRGGYPDCEVRIPLRSRGWIVKSSRAQALRNNSQLNAALNRQGFDLENPADLSPRFMAKEHDVAGEFFEMSTLRCSSNEPTHDQFVPLFTLNRPKKTADELAAEFYVNFSSKSDACLRRLYVMAYVPSGFWSRLITRLLGDEVLPNLFDEYFKSVPSPVSSAVMDIDLDLGRDSKFNGIMNSNKPQWLLWQTGLEVNFLNRMLFCIKEFLPLAQIRDFNYKDTKFRCRTDNGGPLAASTPINNQGQQQPAASLVNVDTDKASIVEIVIPSLTVNLRYQDSQGKPKLVSLESDLQAMTRLMAMVVETMDTLLEDWYPSLGTRFVHTSEGKYLVNRIVPCPYCLLLTDGSVRRLSSDQSLIDSSDDWSIFSLSKNSPSDQIGRSVHQQVKCVTVADQSTSNIAKPDGRVIKSKTFDCSSIGIQRRASTSSQDSGLNESSAFAGAEIAVKSNSINEIGRFDAAQEYAYAFTVEELILAAYEATLPVCSFHGPMAVASIAPDIVFLDLNFNQIVEPEHVKRTKMLGRGAFGFVFKASVKFKSRASSVDVALKMLQPVDPGFSAKQSALCAYKAAWSKWQRDPTQYACRAYTTARQELSVLLNLKHPNVVPLLGVCTKPLALVLGLAPCGSLNALLQSYRRSGAYLNLTVLQETAAQVSKALEYLHQQHIIYRDLKSDNVLVWQFPPAFSKLTNVEVKLGDYGISRSILPTGGAKGFGGTEGYMAPEIMRYNGEEEYTEKVDCFSFAMFLYELLTLKLPFEGHEQVKEFILDGGRPQLTAKELLYPSNIIDLMIVCWSQHSADRPSSSQLVSITTAPEFAHMLDVVSLNSSDAAIVAGEAFMIDDCVTCDDSSFSMGNQFDGETWLSRADGLVSILSCNQNGWLDYKNVVLNEESFVTSLCLVEDTIWMGELTGLVHIFCVKTYAEIGNFSMAPYVLPNDRSPRHQCSLRPVEMIHLPALKSVLICINRPGSLLLCTISQALSGNTFDMASCIKSPQELGAISCCAAVLLGDMSYAVWCGHTAGYISMFNLENLSFKNLGCVNHYDPVIEGVEVSRLVSSPNNGRYVWSYIYPGCVLYQWDVNQRSIVSKLDCSKIAPCSESINTLNIEERLNPGHCQVTSLTLVEKEECTQLYVGTTWGVLIVTEADQLKPITAFRPHLDEIRVIVPINQQKRVNPFSIGRFSSSTNQNVGRLSTTSVNDEKLVQKSLQKRQSDKNAPLQDKSSGSIAAATASTTSSKIATSTVTDSSYVITVGKGYRGLIPRFLDMDQKEDQSVLESRCKDFFAILWRTDDWFNA